MKTKSEVIFLALFTLLFTAIVITIPNQAQATTENQKLTVANQMGGSVLGVAKEGNYIYTGMGPRVVILDGQDPAQPIPVGQTEVLSHIVRHLAIAGNYLYVAAGDFLIFDVSDPADPVQIGLYNMPGQAARFMITSNYAYVAEREEDGTGGGLRILDISAPTNPQETGYVTGSPYTDDVAVAGDYAYLASGYGMAVIDVSNPATPTEVDYVSVPDFVSGVAVSGSHVYLARGEYGLGTYSLSDPAHPELVSGHPTQDQAYGVTIADGHAYVADYLGGVRIFDVSNPEVPTPAGSYELPGLTATWYTVAAGDHLYVAYDNSGLRIVDISDSLTEIGSYDVLGYVRTVHQADNYLYVTDSYEGLRIFDLTDPVDPVEMGHYETNIGLLDIDIVGDYLYTTGGGGFSASKLEILDVSEPSSPSHTGTYTLTGGFPNNVTVSDGYAYVAVGYSGLQLVDVSVPASPTAAGFLDIEAEDVAIAGSYGYVAGWDAGLQVVDVSMPLSPTLIATADLTYTVNALSVQDNYAYVGEDVAGLRVFDVSDPHNPSQVGFHELPWEFNSIEVAGSRLYASGRNNENYVGVTAVIDITDPSQPTLIDQYNTSGYAWNVTPKGVYTYVADGRGGLLILRDAIDFKHHTFLPIALSN